MDLPFATWISLVAFLSYCSCFSFRDIRDSTRATQLRLMEKSDISDGLPLQGASIRETDIAAIFRGVAYGVPTQVFPNISSPSPLSSTATPSFYLSSGVRDEKYKNDISFHTSLAPTNVEKPVIDSLQNYPYENDDIDNGNIKQKNSILKATTTSFSPITYEHYEKNKNHRNQTLDLHQKGVGSKGNYSYDIRSNIGLVWWVQVYVSIVLFTLLAIVTLFFMASFVITTHLLPRPHYLILHSLIFMTASMRIFHTFHDAHTLRYQIPVTLLTTVEESIWPCLTAALAVILVAVLKSWRYPRHPHLALALGLITFVHLITLPVAHLSTVLLKEGEDIHIKTTTRAVTAAWGGFVGVGGIWAVWREGRDYASELADVPNIQYNCPNVAHPARLVFTATLTQLLLVGFHLYILIGPVAQEGHTWIWWSCSSITRGLELIVGGTLVSAAALTLDKANQCAIFKPCCQKRAADIVHSSEIKMIHPMGIYTLQSPKPKNEHAQTIAALSLSNAHKEKYNSRSIDYVTSDFQLVWSHNQQRPISSAQTMQRLIGNDAQNTFTLSGTPRRLTESYVNTNAFSRTLPRNRQCASPSFKLSNEAEKIRLSRNHDYLGNFSTILNDSRTLCKLNSSPKITLKNSKSWDAVLGGQAHEIPKEGGPYSVEECLKEVSNKYNSNSGSSYPSELKTSKTYDSIKRSGKRYDIAHYLTARQFTTHQSPSSSPDVDVGHEYLGSTSNCESLSLHHQNSSPSDRIDIEAYSSQIDNDSIISNEELFLRQDSSPTRLPDIMQVIRQNSSPLSINYSFPAEEQSDDFSIEMTHPIVMPPAPFLSCDQDTIDLLNNSIPQPISQIDTNQYVHADLTSPNERLKPDHHEGY